MSPIKLITPTLGYKSQILAYRDEFPFNPNGIEGSSELVQAETIEDWLSQVEKIDIGILYVKVGCQQNSISQWIN